VQRLKRLEGVVEKMSTVIVGFADKMLHEEILQQYPALATDVQNVIKEVLRLAYEAGDPEETRSSERYEQKSPEYGDDESVTRRSSQDSASLAGSQNLLIGMPFSFDPHDMFTTRSPLEHSQLRGSPQVVYPTRQDTRQDSRLPCLPPSFMVHSLGSGLWDTPTSLPSTSVSSPPLQSRFNTVPRLSEQAAPAHTFLDYPDLCRDEIRKNL
jgi:hypothetical protein